MFRVAKGDKSLGIRSLVEQIISSGQMSQQQHLLLTSTILAGRHINEEDRRLINRVLDYIQIGRIQLIEER